MLTCNGGPNGYGRCDRQLLLPFEHLFQIFIGRPCVWNIALMGAALSRSVESSQICCPAQHPTCPFSLRLQLIAQPVRVLFLGKRTPRLSSCSPESCAQRCYRRLIRALCAAARHESMIRVCSLNSSAVHITHADQMKGRAIKCRPRGGTEKRLAGQARHSWQVQARVGGYS